MVYKLLYQNYISNRIRLIEVFAETILNPIVLNRRVLFFNFLQIDREFMYSCKCNAERTCHIFIFKCSYFNCTTFNYSELYGLKFNYLWIRLFT